MDGGCGLMRVGMHAGCVVERMEEGEEKARDEARQVGEAGLRGAGGEGGGAGVVAAAGGMGVGGMRKGEEEDDVLRQVLDCLMAHTGGEVAGDGRGAAVLALVCRAWRCAPMLLRRLEIRGGAGWKRRLSEDALSSLGWLVGCSAVLSRLRLDRRALDARAIRMLVGSTCGAGASLRHLDLRVNCLRGAGVSVLADAILLGGWGRGLATLDLTHNDLGDEGAMHVARMMSAPGSKLKHLFLNDNRMGAAAGAHLGLALARYEGAGLEVLSLGGNDLGDEGGVSLAEGLSFNCALQELQVAGNRLGDRFALAMAVALGTNHTLSTLNLYCNRIGEDGTRALSAALVGAAVIVGQARVPPNKTLREINVSHSYATLSNEAKEGLRVAVEANRFNWEAAVAAAAVAAAAAVGGGLYGGGVDWSPAGCALPPSRVGSVCSSGSSAAAERPSRDRTPRDPPAARGYRQIRDVHYP